MDKGSAVLAYSDDCVFDAKKITVQGGATGEEDFAVGDIRASEGQGIWTQFSRSKFSYRGVDSYMKRYQLACGTVVCANHIRVHQDSVDSLVARAGIMAE